MSCPLPRIYTFGLEFVWSPWIKSLITIRFRRYRID